MAATSLRTPYVSPLAHPGHVQEFVKPLASKAEKRALERGFVNDAVKTDVFCYPRNIPIIPTFDALVDKQSRKYFESEFVKRVIDVTMGDKEIQPKNKSSINKLSVRGRCPPSPSPEVVDSMERDFVNDAIITEKKRTRYNDTLLPKYDGARDAHCSSYFNRPDIRSQLTNKKFRELPVTTWRMRPLTPLLPRESRDPVCELSSLSNRMTQSMVFEDEYNVAHSMALNKSPRRQTIQDLLNNSPYNDKSSPRRSQEQPGGSLAGSGMLRNSKTSLRHSQSFTDVSRSNQARYANQANRPNPNKLSYRRLAMPTPSVERLREREMSFLNDAIRTEKGRTRYKDLIPPYDARFDSHAGWYHQQPYIKELVSMTRNPQPFQENATSIDGPVMDYFHTKGKGYQYLSTRNQFGAGHSRETIDGHSQFMQGIKPVTGYNGPYGFRRNTPWLRKEPSPFGVSTLSETHEDGKKNVAC